MQTCEQASHGGEVAHAVEVALVGEDAVTQFGAVIARSAEGRRTDDEITAFDSTGLAIQDLAIALAALEQVDGLNLPALDLGAPWSTPRPDVSVASQHAPSGS